MSAKPEVCRPCAELQGRWLDTTPQRLFRDFGWIMQAHVQTSYGKTSRGMNEPRKMRRERWRELVNRQRQSIADQCRAGDHAGPTPERSPRPPVSAAWDAEWQRAIGFLDDLLVECAARPPAPTLRIASPRRPVVQLDLLELIGAP